MKKKVALIFGGRSLERDISVITAMQTLANIDVSKYEVECIYALDGDFYAKKLDSIKRFAPFVHSEHVKVFLIKGEFYSLKKSKLVRFFKPDVALLCCHGGEGENGIVQALLEYNGIAYTSCDVLRSACLMDKALSKRLFESLLLNVLPYEIVLKSEFENDKQKTLERLENLIGYPMIVKPSSQGSSIGIEVAKCREELDFALQVAAKYDSKIVVEQKLEDFVEVNCAAYQKEGKIVLSDTEQPCSKSDFLTFSDKKDECMFAYRACADRIARIDREGKHAKIVLRTRSVRRGESGLSRGYQAQQGLRQRNQHDSRLYGVLAV